MQNESMKAQAWLIANAVSNLFSETPKQTIDELWPHEEPKKNPGQVDINNLEEIAAACSKHGITPPKE